MSPMSYESKLINFWTEFSGGFELLDPFNAEPNALLAIQRSWKCQGKDANDHFETFFG